MMDTDTCAEKVWGKYYTNQCRRKPGYGRGGLYCKQHAKRHPADDQETVTMYAVRQEYGSFDVAVCQVFDVTDASLVIHSAQAIFGYAPSSGHTRKAPGSQWWFFDTAAKALTWVVARMGGKVASLQSEIARIEQNLEPVQRMLKLEDLEQRVDDAVAERITSIKKELGWNET